MEPKKISFGFSKITKTNILTKKPAPVEDNKVQLIEYLEGQSIKVVGGQDDKPKELLVIPMKAPNKKLINLVDIVQNNFVDKEEEPVTKEEQNDSTENGKKDLDAKPLSLDELAAKELLNDLKKPEPKEENQRIIEVEKEKVNLEGEKESTIEDYESIPVEDFGKAMLRGMGWKDGTGVGKNQQLVKIAQPPLRPKGMGLGADKLTKQDTNVKPAVDRDGKVLSCVKGAYVKVIAGYHKGSYGQIIGFDDESGRFIIKTALNNLNISLNEFLVIPVTKEDYNKNSKVINNAKYDEYIKKKEAEKEIALKMEAQQSVKTKKEHSSSSEEEVRPNKKEDKRDLKVQEKTRQEEKKINKRNMSSDDEDEKRKNRRDDKSRFKIEEKQEKHRNKREYEEERKSNRRDLSSEEEDKKRRYRREDKSRSKSDNKSEEKRKIKSKQQEEKTEEKRRNKNEYQEEKSSNKRDLYSEDNKQIIKKEKSRKYSESESESSDGRYRKKVKKEELTDEEHSRSKKKDKSLSKRSTKYDSEDEKDRRRDKNREKKRHHTSSASDSEDSEQERHKKKKAKKKHKKSKKRLSEDSADEKHRKKKKETKYSSDSEQERKKSKRKKEEKDRR